MVEADGASREKIQTRDNKVKRMKVRLMEEGKNGKPRGEIRRKYSIKLGWRSE